MEIYTCNIDGSNLKQITNLGNANWLLNPFFVIKAQPISHCAVIFNSSKYGILPITFEPLRPLS